jgi:N-acetylmuramoyl-L-alanine amidase
MGTGAEALARLCDPTAEVSAHYLIEEDGRVFALVDEDARAWHAGRAFWRGVRDINSTSIGIELVNPGHAFGYRLFPKPQIDALIALGRDIVTRHRIAAHNVVGHSDIAPGRKQDPGELFPWHDLARAGIGFWPTAKKVHPENPWQALSAIGYAVPDHAGGDLLDPLTGAKDVITAFQQRFRPARTDGLLDPETESLIADVAAHTPTA